MTKKDTILIADDDAALRQVFGALLELEGFNVLRAADGAECLRLTYEHHPDLILLDIMMPGKDGREVCRRIREVSDVPIIMLTALSVEEEKVGRLTDGADDYVTKPFHNIELIARIRAVLRRTKPEKQRILHVYDDGYLNIDFETHKVQVRNELVELSPKEWRLLEYFFKNANRILTRQSLLRHVWGDGLEGESNYLKVFVSHLRHKFSDSFRKPRYIHTERNIGYRFETHT